MQKELIEYIAKSLVDDPASVVVEEKESEKDTVLTLKVSDGVIGKQGRIAHAIRTLLSACSGKSGKRYTLEILD